MHPFATEKIYHQITKQSGKGSRSARGPRNQKKHKLRIVRESKIVIIKKHTNIFPLLPQLSLFTVPYIYPNTLHDHKNQTKNRTTTNTTTTTTIIITNNSTSELNRFIQTNAASSAAAANVDSTNVRNPTIYMPAATSKYPALNEPRSVQQELYAKFHNFLTQWINTFVYLARKSKHCIQS